MQQDFTDQTVLVTGATSGIGRATALLFAARGARVVVAGRDKRRGDEVVQQIGDAGSRAHFIAADLSSPTGAERLIADVLWLASDIDVLVNNAGATPMTATAEITDELFRQVFAVNVRAPMALVAALAPAMAARGHGAIVNVTSLAAERGLSVMGLYGASKAALAALTRSWADEFGPAGIRVNAVSPALISTEGTAHVEQIHRRNAARAPGRRIGEPIDAAEVIAFLAAPTTRHLHGAILPVDGGMLAIA